MKLVVSASKKGTKPKNVSVVADQKTAGFTQEAEQRAICIDTAILMLENIVESACEYEQDITLMRLVSLIDLYGNYLKIAGKPDFPHKSEGNEPVDFESFIKDSYLLDIAAHAATLHCADHVATPVPLGMSANR